MEPSPIPQPPTMPLVGNLHQVALSGPPIENILRLSRTYGPLFRLQMQGRKITVASGFSVIEELCDDERFDKLVDGPMEELRAAIGDGLLTADTGAPNWGLAHRILRGAFRLQAMKTYLPVMTEVTGQLVARWASRSGADPVPINDDTTRLTLAIIARCGFGHRLGVFERDTPHPFVEALNIILVEGQRRRLRPALIRDRLPGHRRRWTAPIAVLHRTVDEVIAARRADPRLNAAQADLLSLMMTGRDEETGQGLSDENIRFQILTFLAAGHETTAGLLSFALHHLSQRPDVQARAREEVAQVMGDAAPDAPPSWKQVLRLRYIGMVLKEALRLWPPLPVVVRTPREDTLLGGRFAVRAGEPLIVLLLALHRDPAVWTDPERFDPERFTPERTKARPFHAHKPFGVGVRACIGRQFATVEATIALAMLLRRFTFAPAPGYALRLSHSMTLNPRDLRLVIRPHPGTSPPDR